ncbi:hypothetical protein FQR65_LT07768 [Abscondita terminalis]|nr:hypothetical protein FQR65_LT07768 [Abscondita terminalis]
MTTENLKILSLDVKDIRFPTSLGGHGSDAMHTDPDYSCAYVILKTAKGTEGHGLTFTCGRGTEIVVKAIESLSYMVVGQTVVDIFKDFGAFWRNLTSETQIRWLGPEKGVTHLATAAIINALWDLWAKLLNKPLWRLLVDLEPEQLVSAIDFRYITDVITKEEALEILHNSQNKKDERIAKLTKKGYPAYTTQVGWLGYSNELITELCQKYLDMGFISFKVKVGKDLQDDIKRLTAVRNVIGWDKQLMVDANQVWEVQEAIEWMKNLSEFKLHWIEEPTSPDDILGHATIAKALKPLGIGVATGEMCCNRVMFKQFLQADALQFCQIDSARIGGVNELLSVYLMAHKFGVKVCPHAGGIGLCEMVQHLQMWDYVAVSGTKKDRIIEYVDQQHEHFVNPCIVENACYQVPKAAGYSTTLWPDTIAKYEYPNGTEWQNMFSKGLFSDPRKQNSPHIDTMGALHLLGVITIILGVTYAHPSAVELFQDVYQTCLKEFSLSCVKPKSLSWLNKVIKEPVIKISDDLEIVRTDDPEASQERSNMKDVFDAFEDFIQSHRLVAKVPEILRLDGPLGSLVPRSFRPEELSVPLANTGRSKAVKKIIVPFLLGLKFKTAVIVPLALALIALKTWKALTLGLLSLVLTGALLIFKLSHSKVTTYEVLHYPHHHHVDHHHVEHHPPSGWEHPGYGRQIDAQELAYNGYAHTN